MAVYHALLQRGDTVMGLSLDQGGHLTHGSPVNFSGQYYNFVAYHVDRDTHLIDMDEVAALAREHRPKLIVPGRPPTRASGTSPPSAPSPTRLAPS